MTTYQVTRTHIVDLPDDPAKRAKVRIWTEQKWREDNGPDATFGCDEQLVDILVEIAAYRGDFPPADLDCVVSIDEMSDVIEVPT